MCPLSGNSTLSNKFKVLHDKEKMDNCNGYFEVKEKEENVASGNVAHDFDLGSDKTMVKGFESFDSDSNYSESQEMVALMVDSDDNDSVSWDGHGTDKMSLSKDGTDLANGEVEETRGRDEVVAPESKKFTVTGWENVADDRKIMHKIER